MRTLLKSAILATTLLAGAAQAATLVPGAGWSIFFFGDVGSPLTDGATGDLTWDFTLTESALLQVTDAFVIGDQFEIFNDGVSLGVTDAFELGNPELGDPDAAFAAGYYSTLSVLLGPGTYSISGITVSSPVGSGGAYIQLAETDAVVPEPASWALMIAGFGLVGGAMRRRAATAIAL